jgi:hypothetical protein
METILWWGLAESAFGESPKSGGRLCVGACGVSRHCLGSRRTQKVSRTALCEGNVAVNCFYCLAVRSAGKPSTGSIIYVTTLFQL